MKINIASVLNNDGASMSFSETFNMDSFEFMGSHLNFIAPVNVEGNVSNIGGTIEISAHINGDYSTQCSRCCEDILLRLEADLTETVSESFSDFDEECFSLTGTILDIEGAVRACIFNNIPLKFLCSEDCRGLCPVCGTNLNKNECNCEEEVYDPRFAIFRNLQQRGVTNGSSKE